MDANERLKFINRLNGLTGDQAREALKQMAINCNTKQTTIARALRNAVDQHAPMQYLVPVAAPSSPPIATPSTTARSNQKTKVRDKRDISDSSEESADDEPPASKKQKKQKNKRGDINPDPNIGRHVLEKSSPKRKSAQFEAATGDSNRHGALFPRNGKKDKTSPANNKNNKLETKRERIKEEAVVVIDSTSESDSSDSDSSDSDSSDSDAPDNGGLTPDFPNHEYSGDDNLSSLETSDTDSSDSDSSDSDESIDINPDRRKLLQGSVSSRRTTHGQDEQPAAKKNAVKPQKTAVSAPADTAEKSKLRGQADGAAKASSSTVTRKRKAEKHDEADHTNEGESVQENKKAKTTEFIRPVEDRTCRNCLEVFETRTHLFRHLYSRRHLEISPTKPLSAPEKQPTGRSVHTDIKKEPDDQFESPSTSTRKAKPARETLEAMSPPAFIKEPNSFPRGPTPAPMVLARQRSDSDATSHAVPVRPAAVVASSPHTPRPAQSSRSQSILFRPQWVGKTADVQELKCRFCYEFFKRSDSHVEACRRHDGEW